MVRRPFHTEQTLGKSARKSKTILNIVILGQHYSGLNIAISPDGEWVASGNWHGMEGVKLWRTRTRTLEQTIPMGGVHLAYSPDGRWLAVSGMAADHSFQLQIWETVSWTLQHSWTDPSFRNQPVFSPDSRVVAFVQRAAENPAARGRELSPSGHTGSSRPHVHRLAPVQSRWPPPRRLGMDSRHPALGFAQGA